MTQGSIVFFKTQNYDLYIPDINITVAPLKRGRRYAPGICLHSWSSYSNFMKQFFTNLLFIGISVLCLTACQSTVGTQALVEAEGQLVWVSGDTSAYELEVHLDAEETDTVQLPLKLGQTGLALPADEHVRFRVDDIKSSAIAGRHVLFPQGMQGTISAGNTESANITMVIQSEHILAGSDLELVLYLLPGEHIPVADQSNLRELRIRISKAPRSLPVHYLQLRSPGSSSGLTLVDLDALIVYTRREPNVDAYLQKSIDFGFWNSVSKDYVFMVPTDSVRLAAWGSGQVINEEWANENKNDGILIRLPASTANEALFTDAQTETDVLDAFEEAADRVALLNTNDYGPGGHIHELQTGDIIFFESLSRNLKAIIRIDASTSGNSGTMDLSVKRIYTSPE